MSELEIKQKHQDHTPEYINKLIGEYDPNCANDNDAIWAYRVVMTIPIVGPFMNQTDVFEKVEKFWNVDSPQVRTFLRRAINNRIFRYGKKNQEQFLCPEIYDENGVGIALGASIVRGWIRRMKASSKTIETRKSVSELH